MTQAQALTVLKTGANVFLTGEPGAGKTYVLNQYTQYLREHGISVAITAPTGIAATHIGGMTIHSWSGIGINTELSPYDLDRITTREYVAKRVKNADVLVIDEISMLDANTFEMVDEVCRAVRQNNEPFGGLQVVLVGDFFQLPPVARQGDMTRFAFESGVWHKLGLLTCYLDEQYRHRDEVLSALLLAIRRGEVDETHTETLAAYKETVFDEHIEPTRLYTHNIDVDRINGERLAAIDGEVRTFKMEKKGSEKLTAGLVKSCLSPEVLELKEGAAVMCTKNNFDAGFANGTLGSIVGYDRDSGYPIIKTADGERITIAPMEWSISDDGKVLASATQVPLRLAWAITVHKSQGMSLDAVEVDLSSAFAHGQGYVALSRVRTLAGLRVNGCNTQALMVHPQVVAVDGTLKEQSETTATTFDELPEEEITELHHQFIRARGGTIAKQKLDKKGRPEKVSTFAKTLELLKEGKSVAQIAEVRGIKQKTVIDHIEKLLAEGKAKPDECDHLRFSKEAGDMPEHLSAAFEKLGTEKLKPVYQHTKGKYTYDDIQLARMLFQYEML